MLGEKKQKTIAYAFMDGCLRSITILNTYESSSPFDLYRQSCNSRRRVDSCGFQIKSVDGKIANEILFFLKVFDNLTENDIDQDSSSQIQFNICVKKDTLTFKFFRKLLLALGCHFKGTCSRVNVLSCSRFPSGCV